MTKELIQGLREDTEPCDWVMSGACVAALAVAFIFGE